VTLLNVGADVGTMVTGLSAITAAAVWTRNERDAWKQSRIIRARRNWHGYIMTGNMTSWYVRSVDRRPDDPPGRVTVDVLRERYGEPDEQMAHGCV
jgi:hypothetical protein